MSFRGVCLDLVLAGISGLSDLVACEGEDLNCSCSTEDENSKSGLSCLESSDLVEKKNRSDEVEAEEIS